MTGPETAAEQPNESFLRERRFSRQTALQFFYQADQQQDWGNVERNLNLLRKQVREFDDCPEDAAFARAWRFTDRLVRGVCASRDDIDRLLGECATNWRVDRMSIIDRNILRLTAFQLTSCDDIPAVAAIDEAIELARLFGDKDSTRFVNGVLDHLLRRLRANPPAEPDASSI